MVTQQFYGSENPSFPSLKSLADKVEKFFNSFFINGIHIALIYYTDLADTFVRSIIIPAVHLYPSKRLVY